MNIPHCLAVLGFLTVATAEAVTVSEAMTWADQGGKLGMQALLLLLLGGVAWLFLKGQKEAKEDRAARFGELKEANSKILVHHEAFAHQMKEEREEMNKEREAKFNIVVQLQRETNSSLNANTAAINGLSQVVHDLAMDARRRESA